MVHYAQDYEDAKPIEKELLPILRVFFNRDLKQTAGQFAQYDYWCGEGTDDETVWELKTRFDKAKGRGVKMMKNKYDSTMLVASKLKPDGRFHNAKKIYLVFNFKDRLCYIQYDEQKFSEYQHTQFIRSNDEGVVENTKDHIYIPTEDLTDILDWDDTFQNCEDCGFCLPENLCYFCDGGGKTSDLWYCSGCVSGSNEFIVG